MGFLFTCPHCGVSTEVDESFAGEVGPCFSCGKTVELPQDIAPNLAAASQLVLKRKRSDRKRLAGVMLIATVVALIMAASIWVVLKVVIPLATPDPNLAAKERTFGQLRQIGLAMLAYHDEYGSFPPAYLSDEQGKPMHSWRVLLLPYLGEEALYRSYDFSQPWDGPENSSLIPLMPSIYASPLDDPLTRSAETGVMVIMGDRTPFPGAGTTNLTDLRDGPENTILAVEVVSHGTSWTEPLDLDASKMVYQIDGRFDQEIGSRIEGGAHVVFADGDVEFLGENTPRNRVEALVTRDAGDPADQSQFGSN